MRTIHIAISVNVNVDIFHFNNLKERMRVANYTREGRSFIQF